MLIITFPTRNTTEVIPSPTFEINIFKVSILDEIMLVDCVCWEYQKNNTN